MMKLLPLLMFALQEIVASSTGAVTGRLLSADGTPAANVRVALSPADGAGQTADQSLLSITTTDNAGRYRMDQVPPGLYYVTAGLVNTPTYFPGVGTRERALPMRVTAGGVVEAPDFRLATIPEFQIRGRVELENIPMDRVGRPMMVRINGGRTVTLAADGSFELSGPPGKYYLMVTPNVSMPGVTVNLVDQDIVDLRIRVPSSALNSSVIAEVQVEGDGLVPPLQVVLTNTAGAARVATRLATGSTYYVSSSPPGATRLATESTYYDSSLPPGEYTASVRNLPEGYSVQSITVGSTDLLSEKLRLNPTDQPQIIIKLGVSNPPPWVRLQGRMVDVEKMKLPSTITLHGQGRSSAMVAADGTFEFPRILPGIYRAMLTPDDRFVRIVTVGKTNPAFAVVPLTIPSFKVSGTLNGEAEMRRQGRLDPNCTLGPYLMMDGLVGEGYPTARAILGPNGSFEFFPVQAGSYKLGLASGCYDVINGGVGNAVPFVVVDKDITGLVISPR